MVLRLFVLAAVIVFVAACQGAQGGGPQGLDQEGPQGEPDAPRAVTGAYTAPWGTPVSSDETREFQRSREEAQAVKAREIEIIGGEYPAVENEGDLPDLSADRLESALRETLIDYFGGLRHRHRSRLEAAAGRSLQGIDLSVSANPSMDMSSSRHSRQLAERGGYENLNPPEGLFGGACGRAVFAVGMKVGLVRESDWLEKYSRARAINWHADELSRARATVGTLLSLPFLSAGGRVKEQALFVRYVGVGVAEGRDDRLGTDAWYVTIMLSPCAPEGLGQVGDGG